MHVKHRAANIKYFRAATSRFHPAILNVSVVLANHCIQLLRRLTRRIILVTVRCDFSKPEEGPSQTQHADVSWSQGMVMATADPPPYISPASRRQPQCQMMASKYQWLISNSEVGAGDWPAEMVA